MDGLFFMLFPEQSADFHPLIPAIFARTGSKRGRGVSQSKDILNKRSPS
jgi:hypothetical protein